MPDFDAAWMNLTQPELESLAVILIRELTANLKGKAIAGYLNAMRHGSTDIPPSLVHLVFPPPSIDLPAHFPDVQTPRYLYGDKLRWISEGDKTDWGHCYRQILQLCSPPLRLDVVLHHLAR
jgi:hypothetical protein